MKGGVYGSDSANQAPNCNRDYQDCLRSTQKGTRRPSTPYHLLRISALSMYESGIQILWEAFVFADGTHHSERSIIDRHEAISLQALVPGADGPIRRRLFIYFSPSVALKNKRVEI